MHIVRRQTCRVCGSKALKPAISLGEQHLQGSFLKEGILVPNRKVPMNLVRCDPENNENACGLLQAEYTVPPEMMYATYWYKSGVNATMRNHLRDLVASVSNKLGDNPWDKETRVLDIGCNDGTLLGFYPPTIDRWGVDPSNITCSIKDSEIKIVNDFFPSPAFRERMGSGQVFDVITAIAMFYDLEHPVSFVQEVEFYLKPHGIFCFEMSHMVAMLKQNSYDTLCHEHIEYYSFAVIEEILRRGGMKAVSVTENNINGGSIRVFAMKTSSEKKAGRSVEKMRVSEFDLKLDTDEPYIEFQKRADIHRTDLLMLLNKIKDDRKTIHVYGASTKGNTLLQWCNIDRRLIDFAADRNPDKHGAFTPGSNIPIVSEEESRALKPDFYLVLPWHFRQEILEREKDIRATGTRFIFPLPQIEILGG